MSESNPPQAALAGVRVLDLSRVLAGNGARLELSANPLRLSATPSATRSAPPPLGQDTETVLRELLGASDAELRAWREASAI